MHRPLVAGVTKNIELEQPAEVTMITGESGYICTYLLFTKDECLAIIGSYCVLPYNYGKTFEGEFCNWNGHSLENFCGNNKNAY